MKIKYFFALILVLTVMFSLGTIAAGEDIDFNASSLEDTYLSSGGAEIPISDNDCEDIQSSSNEDIEMNSSADDADLYVDMELGDTEKTTYGINNITFDVPLIVTAKALEGNVKNAKVYINIPGEFKYLSFNKTAGEYDPESGIWNIGDLDEGSDAVLTIFTKTSTQGTFNITVNSTTDSNDVNLTNNDLIFTVNVASKVTSGTTRTSRNAQGPKNNHHHGSSTDGFIDRQKDDDPQPAGGGEGLNNNQKDNGNATATGGSSHGKTNIEKNGNSGSGSDDGASSNSKSGAKVSPSISKEKNALKAVNPNIIDSVTKSIGDTINDILNPDSDKGSDDSSNPFKSSGVTSAYDYTTIPLLIFALFLILLLGIVATDKIKS